MAQNWRFMLKLSAMLLAAVLAAGCSWGAADEWEGLVPADVTDDSSASSLPTPTLTPTPLLLGDRGDLTLAESIKIMNRVTGEIREYTDSGLLEEWVAKFSQLQMPDETFKPFPAEGGRYSIDFTGTPHNLLYITVDEIGSDADEALFELADTLFAEQVDWLELPEERQQIIVDLNGDGVKETVAYWGASGADEFVIQVNDAQYQSRAINLTGLVEIVDLDTSDSYLEIVVSEDGPSADPLNYYFTYTEDGEIQYAGKVRGYPDALHYSGDGSLQTSQYLGSILQTWFYTKTFRLDANRQLQPVDEAFYSMNTAVTLLQEFTLLQERGSEEEAFTLYPGDKATITGSDDKAWCQLETEDGRLGWFEVEGFDQIKGTPWRASEIFDGLSYAG